MDELVIDESNFSQYFKDVRTNKPESGQVMAVYTAIAELMDGNLKRDIIYLLSHTAKYNETVTLFRKIGLADHEDAIRVCKEIAEDLKNKVPTEEILKKPYSYKLQGCYWTKKEHIPTNDPHWSFVEIANLDDHLERVEHIGGAEIRSKWVESEKEVDESAK